MVEVEEMEDVEEMEEVEEVEIVEGEVEEVEVEVEEVEEVEVEVEEVEEEVEEVEVEEVEIVDVEEVNEIETLFVRQLFFLLLHVRIDIYFHTDIPHFYSICCTILVSIEEEVLVNHAQNCIIVRADNEHSLTSICKVLF